MSIPYSDLNSMPQRCLNSIVDCLNENKEPLRHLNLVEQRPEWKNYFVKALMLLQNQNKIVSFEHSDGFKRYALVSRD